MALHQHKKRGSKTLTGTVRKPVHKGRTLVKPGVRRGKVVVKPKTLAGAPPVKRGRVKK